MLNTFGFAMQSFALGGLAQWAAPFLKRSHGMPLPTADLWAGGIVVGSGLLGTAVGSLLADFFAKKSRIPAYAIVTGIGYLAAAPLLAIGLFLPTGWALAFLFLSMVGAFLGIGPSNAIVAARAPALHRATAFALVVFILHFFGDAASPPLLGWFSDAFQENGMPEGPALQRALILTAAALLLGAIFMFACALFGREKSAAPAPESLPK
jgi:MFS family permease